MKLTTLPRLSLAAALSLSCVAGSALAERPSPLAPRVTRVLVDPGMVSTSARTLSPAAEPPSRTIYMNRCAGGCTVQPGYDSSIDNTSSILRSTANFEEFKWGDDEWQQLLSCVRETYSPFNVTVTDQDPGQVPHWEIIVAGAASEAGMPAGVLGVSPWVGQCPEPIIDNAITYAFLNDPYARDDINEMCWIVAQETAHSFGLDHEALANDPMTYIGLDSSQVSRHSFMDEDAACGAYTADDDGCYCLGTTQNSYQALMDIFGPLNPTPPSVAITEPADGASLRPGFDIAANINDDQGVGSVDLLIDGTVVETLTQPPFTFDSPASIAEGSHQITITATDLQGTPGTANVSVNIGPPCQSGDECSGQGDGLTCVAGQCVPGPDAAGGLGTTCTKSEDCSSGQCASDSTDSYCVEKCQLGSKDCPGGFDCIDADGNGVCWPSSGGGCAVAGGAGGSGSPLPPVGLALLLGMLVLRRRRRR